MKDVILKAVANPPKLFWGPVLPTALNAGLQIPFMFMAIGMGDQSLGIFGQYCFGTFDCCCPRGKRPPLVGYDTGFRPD